MRATLKLPFAPDQKEGLMGRREVSGIVGPKTIVCSECGRRKSVQNDFYATPEGKVRGKKCIACVRRDRMDYHERKKQDPKEGPVYLEKLRRASLNFWFKEHEKNLEAQRARDRRRRGLGGNQGVREPAGVAGSPTGVHRRE
jgi:hypothetical protein